MSMEVNLSAKSIEALAKALAKELRGDKDLISCAEAARMLGVTTQTMRLNKTKYRHTKVGDEKQGRLLFVRQDIERDIR